MQTIGTPLLAVNGAAWRACGWLLKMAVARLGCCTPLLYDCQLGLFLIRENL
jgi:hypothetical protein